MSSAAAIAHDPVHAARALVPRLRALSPRIERERRLPLEIVAELASTGFFALCVPRSLRGEEAHPTTLIRVVEELAIGDAAAAWCVMIGATSGLVAGWLDRAAAEEIFARAPEAVAGGVFTPNGRAVVVPGGYRVTGRWAFASGCQHCAWLMGGCLVEEDGVSRPLKHRIPDSRMLIFPAAEAHVHDTWRVVGLCGTGSHDIEVQDLFVPRERSVSLLTDRPRESGPLYQFPVFGLLATGVCAVALGLARAAIDEFARLARSKRPTGSARTLAERPAVQMDIARAEARISAARSYLLETVAGAYECAREHGEVTLALRARVRLAATHATLSAAKAVHQMYQAAGSTAIYEMSPLQRYFRDVHVVTQHRAVAPATLELAGRMLLGLDTDTSML
ncbi:MAG TPA: hydroxylase [Deltaproteobacteria bacterium]|jgi:alkylation response protein AidB-like acyl-CoA dehydrogenase|nr:hydroxylase [Deltaproteobacteria bacterium]